MPMFVTVSRNESPNVAAPGKPTWAANATLPIAVWSAAMPFESRSEPIASASELSPGAFCVEPAATTPAFAFTSAEIDIVAAVVSAANDSASVYETLANQAETRRSSVNGVSIDEELTLLMRYQQAFQAASRLVKTSDEMMQTLLAMAP